MESTFNAHVALISKSSLAERQIEVRPAAEGDFDRIADLMEEALSPFYGGDHHAHARRIFEAHAAGGYDDVGHFSREQRMWVLTVEGEFAGMLHLVGKKQGTYKISPLILETRFRGTLGLGGILLAYAEDYARQNGARQIYCTVAHENRGALQFFERKGFVIAGESHGHYLINHGEHMLYKNLWLRTDDPEAQLSVIEFDYARHACEVTKLIMSSSLPADFDGVDIAWVNALFDGYGRRGTRDINTKYKLMWVVVDSAGKVQGVVGATPKKGEPIKVMPLVAASPDAFRALILEIPYLLSSYGHKLYMHINPGVSHTMLLQGQGWHLDAAMPGAYRPNLVTQQWSIDLNGETTMQTVRVKKRFFDLIMNGTKPLEVRVGYSNIRSIQTGDRINLATSDARGVVVVKGVKRYDSFVKLLESEDPQLIAPGHVGSVLKLLQKIYSPEKEKLGVYVLRLEPEHPKRSK